MTPSTAGIFWYTKKMNKLSAVIIVKNEEKGIDRCLKSLAGLADEIIVVDDLSQDRTAQICREAGARVISSRSDGNFDRQRNLGMQNASGSWVLQMDADEFVPPDTAAKIRAAIDAPGGLVAFKIRRKNYFLGHFLRYSGAYGYMTKILKKGAAEYSGESVHETLVLRGTVGTIEADIEHYPYESIGQVIQRSCFYNEVEAGLFVKNSSGVSLKEIRYRLTWKALKLFYKLYFRKKGYKDGMHGLAWSILNVMGTQIKWLKIWEIALKEGKLTGVSNLNKEGANG